MLKQFQKAVKNKADSLAKYRPNRSELPTDLKEIEQRVEKFRKIVQLLEKKIPPLGQVDEEKRKRKILEHSFATSIDELIRTDLQSEESSLKTALSHCSAVQKELTQEKLRNEDNIGASVWQALHQVQAKLEQYQKQKAIDAKCASDLEAAKSKYKHADSAIASSKTKGVEASQVKIEQYKEEMEECESRLDKERDIYVSYMYELLAEEETVVKCLMDYVNFQEEFYRKTHEELLRTTQLMQEIKVNRKAFGVPLQAHLEASQRQIAFVIEFSVSQLLDRGIHEEGLFRVGCMSHKLQRIKSAIDAGQYTPSVLRDYTRDPHVYAALLKTYLRELPEPLLTHELYPSLIEVASLPPDGTIKNRISRLISSLPTANYDNLRYLMCFLYRFSKELSRTRMTTQNIAIVISPNLLWAQEDLTQTIDAQVNSTSAVNTIVEQLISDYPFFFGAEVELGMPDLNGGFTDTTEVEPKTAALKSQAMSQSMTTYQKSGSDGTSQITLGLPTRSGSSNSISDDAGVPQLSPKLPMRKNKKAPVPPATEKHEAQTQTQQKKAPLVRTTSTEDLGKEFVRHPTDVHNQMYGFNTVGRARSRPSPLPRSSVFPNEKIYENAENVQVQVREKPAIPERPANLPVRPTSKHVTDFSPPNSASSDNHFHHHEPLLRQTSISTISEKSQVAIIDLGGSTKTSKKPPSGRDNSGDRTSVALETFIAHESSNNGHSAVDGTSGGLQQVPRSPRGNGSATKRPQVPAPPPPNSSRPKSGDGSGDSTNL